MRFPISPRAVLAALLFAGAPVVFGGDIAFFYALEADRKALAKEAAVARAPIRIGERSIPVYALGGHKIYAVEMGAGPVATAVSAEALLSKIPVDFALTVGPIGGLGEGVARKSWYRIRNIVAYQKGTYENGGLQMGKSPALAGDRPDIQEKMNGLLGRPPEITVASGEIFVASDAFRKDLAARTKAQAVEMNLFGLAAACENHRTPLYVWRVCSDLANEHASEDFRRFLAEYEGEGGAAFVALVKALPRDDKSPSAYDNLRALLPKN